MMMGLGNAVGVKKHGEGQLRKGEITKGSKTNMEQRARFVANIQKGSL